MTLLALIASVTCYPQGAVYPSNIEPPSAGCWRLTTRADRVAASFIALVRK